MPRIEVFPDGDSLADHAADIFSECAKEAIAAQGCFMAALSGGSTPRKMFGRLSKAPLNWEKIHFFWVDERCVPPDHPDSNFRMVAEALLDRVEIPARNIHRIKGEMEPKEAARAYERDLRDYFGDRFPIFDLVILGLGPDGHIASLFPGSPAVEEKDRWVCAVKHDCPPPPLVDRVTLTLPVLEAARRTLFLVSGREKAGILRDVLSGSSRGKNTPAARLHANPETTSWLLDQEAAGTFAISGNDESGR